MSKGVNKVILIGNLGNDPDSRSFPDGSMVTAISVATSESWKDKNTGQMQERTEWHRVSMRDRGAFKLGQIAAQYLRKGSKVYIEGKLQTRKYSDAQGIERYVTEIIADTVQFLDGKQQDAQQYAVPQQRPVNAQPQYQQAMIHQQPQQSAYPDFDDDIQF